MTALVRLSEKFGACIDGEKLSMQRCKDAGDTYVCVSKRMHVDHRRTL